MEDLPIQSYNIGASLWRFEAHNLAITAWVDDLVLASESDAMLGSLVRSNPPSLTCMIMCDFRIFQTKIGRL